MNRETLIAEVDHLLSKARDEMRPPDYLAVDPATFHSLVPDPQFSMDSPASGTNMSGDSFLEGVPVVFVKKTGIQLGYRMPGKVTR